MHLSVADLVKLESVIQYRISDSIDFIHEVSLLGDPSPLDANVLYCPTYSNGEDGWYSTSFDRSRVLRSLSISKLDWIFLLEKKHLQRYRFRNYILVDNINGFLLEVTKWVRSRLNPKVIGITGSVGKSTLVHIIHNAISQVYPANYIAAKRTTPLIIYDYFLNKLVADTNYLIAEIGLFNSDHVKNLTDIMALDYGILLNVFNMHIGRPGLRSISDVAEGKKYILTSARAGCLNARLKKTIQLAQPDNYKSFSTESNEPSSALISKREEEYVHIQSESGAEYRLPFYIRTRVFEEQLLSAVICLEHLNIEPRLLHDILVTAISKPKIFSLRKVIIGNCIALVDTHASYSGYFEAMSHHYYSDCCLILGSIHCADESIAKNIDKIARTFRAYKRIMLLKSLLKYFHGYRDQVNVISRRDIHRVLSQYQVAIIHDPLRRITSDILESPNMALQLTA